MSFTIPYTEIEKQGALQDVYDIVVNSKLPLKIYGISGKGIERGKYGSIISKDSDYIELNAFPIEYNPTTKELEKVGIFERVDATAYLSTKQVLEKGLKYKDFDLKTITIIDPFETEYRIQTKQNYSQFMDVFLYIILGLLRK